LGGGQDSLLECRNALFGGGTVWKHGGRKGCGRKGTFACQLVESIGKKWVIKNRSNQPGPRKRVPTCSREQSPHDLKKKNPLAIQGKGRNVSADKKAIPAQRGSDPKKKKGQSDGKGTYCSPNLWIRAASPKLIQKQGGKLAET